MTEKQNNRRIKFTELAEKRVNRAIKDLRLIGNLSNKGNYQYTEGDVAKIMRALNEELRKLRVRFDSGGPSDEPEFKL